MTGTTSTACAIPFSERGRLLPAQVEAAIAAGDLDTARAAATELAL